MGILKLQIFPKKHGKWGLWGLGKSLKEELLVTQ
jgi:hypothetical protein